MLKLTLDWAAETPVPEGVDETDELVRVELVKEVGSGGGWPEIAVYVARAEGEPEYMQYMRLVGWLKAVYGADEDEAEELQDMAQEV